MVLIPHLSKNLGQVPQFQQTQSAHRKLTISRNTNRMIVAIIIPRITRFKGHGQLIINASNAQALIYTLVSSVPLVGRINRKKNKNQLKKKKQKRRTEAQMK